VVVAEHILLGILFYLQSFFWFPNDSNYTSNVITYFITLIWWDMTSMNSDFKHHIVKAIWVLWLKENEDFCITSLLVSTVILRDEWKMTPEWHLKYRTRVTFWWHVIKVSKVKLPHDCAFMKYFLNYNTRFLPFLKVRVQMILYNRNYP